MRIKTTLLTGTLCLALTPVALAQNFVLGGPVFNPDNGHSYYLLGAAPWTTSEAEAISLGGHLATINNAAEDAFVYANFSNFGGEIRNLWLGLNDAAITGTYTWTSGEPFVYSHFNPGEPNHNGAEHYIHIYTFGGSGWNDAADTAPGITGAVYGVVEFTAVPEPAEYAAVAGLALVAFGAWRRTRR